MSKRITILLCANNKVKGKQGYWGNTKKIISQPEKPGSGFSWMCLSSISSLLDPHFLSLLLASHFSSNFFSLASPSLLSHSTPLLIFFLRLIGNEFRPSQKNSKVRLHCQQDDSDSEELVIPKLGPV